MSEPTRIPCCWGSIYERSGCTCPTPANLARWAKRDAREKAKQQERDARLKKPDLKLVTANQRS